MLGRCSETPLWGKALRRMKTMVKKTTVMKSRQRHLGGHEHDPSLALRLCSLLAEPASWTQAGRQEGRQVGGLHWVWGSC